MSRGPAGDCCAVFVWGSGSGKGSALGVTSTAWQLDCWVLVGHMYQMGCQRVAVTRLAGLWQTVLATRPSGCCFVQWHRWPCAAVPSSEQEQLSHCLGAGFSNAAGRPFLAGMCACVNL
jgi:hypothetical protein